VNAAPHRPSGRDRKVIDPGTDPADTPNNFLLRSLTTARSSDHDFRGTVLSGIACSPPVSLFDVSMISRCCSCCSRPFHEVTRRTANTSVPARSCRRVRAVDGEAGEIPNGRARESNAPARRVLRRALRGTTRPIGRDARYRLRCRVRSIAHGHGRYRRSVLFLGYAHHSPPPSPLRRYRGELT